MKRCLMLLVLMPAVVGIAGGPVAVQAAESVEITISAPDRSYSDCPVRVVVAAPASAKSVVLSNEKGEAVPAQLSRMGNETAVTLILPELKKGSSATYKASFVDSPAAGDGVKITQAGDAAEVTVGGQLFTKYVFAGFEKPVLYPIIGPYGDYMTRHFPTEKVEPEKTMGVAEKEDHPHQRSAWFTHGDVNGTSYWHVAKDTGEQKHREFGLIESGPVVGRIADVIDWVKKVDSKKDCESIRILEFYNVKNGQLFDWTEAVKATEGPVKFGDTKEGSFGFRVATTMRPEAKKGGKITNAEGQTDGEAWAKASPWCDYTGPVNGKTVGIAIFDHPTSFRHPTYWHVRTYGLFAANPFGLHDFVKEWRNESRGEHTIPKGESTTFRYRVFIHKGTCEEANVAEAYAQYANPPKVTVR